MIGVIIAWRNRPELARTLHENAPLLRRFGAEIVLVNCAGDRDAALNIFSNAGLDNATFVDAPIESFNKSAALNLGVAASAGDTLLLLDADVILYEDYFQAAPALLGTSAYVRLKTLYESGTLGALEPESPLSELIYSITLVIRGRPISIETSRRNFARGSRSAPGIVLCSRQAFEEVDGMNSDLTGWGWEDLDLLVRLQQRLGLPEAMAGSGLHLTHGDEARASAGGPENDFLNFARCMVNYKAGHMLGTWRDDVRAWHSRIELRKIR